MSQLLFYYFTKEKQGMIKEPEQKSATWVLCLYKTL